MGEKVKIDKDKLFKKVEGLDKIYDYPVKEMANGDNIPILRVKRASLDDRIRAETISSVPAILLKKILEDAEKGIAPSVETIKDTMNHPGVHEKTSYEIQLFHMCVIEPKFTIDECIKLSETMPNLVNEVCAFALGLRPEVEDGD